VVEKKLERRVKVIEIVLHNSPLRFWYSLNAERYSPERCYRLLPCPSGKNKSRINLPLT